MFRKIWKFFYDIFFLLRNYLIVFIPVLKKDSYFFLFGTVGIYCHCDLWQRKHVLVDVKKKVNKIWMNIYVSDWFIEVV